MTARAGGVVFLFLDIVMVWLFNLDICIYKYAVVKNLAATIAMIAIGDINFICYDNYVA